MNAVIEAALSAYLQMALEEDHLDDVVVLPGTSSSDVPNSQQSVIIVLRLIHEVGDLYTGDLKVVVSTPAKEDGVTLESHKQPVRGVLRNLLWNIDDPDLATKEAAVEAALMEKASFHYRGFFV